METIHDLSELLSVEHPELARAVDKIVFEISGLNYGVISDEQNSFGRHFLTRQVMKRATARRVDHVEFFMAFFPVDLRAAFLIKISIKFQTLGESWLKAHHAFADHTTSLQADREQVEYLHSLFMQWIDDNLPLVMDGTYQSKGGWF